MILSKSDHMKLHKNNRKPQKPPKKKTFKCIVCGKEFSTLKTKNQKYCSIDCSNKSMHNRKTIVCATCGKEFEVKISDNNRKYCSRDCYEVSRH